MFFKFKYSIQRFKIFIQIWIFHLHSNLNYQIFNSNIFEYSNSNTFYCSDSNTNIRTRIRTQHSYLRKIQVLITPRYSNTQPANPIISTAKSPQGSNPFTRSNIHAEENDPSSHDPINYYNSSQTNRSRDKGYTYRISEEKWDTDLDTSVYEQRAVVRWGKGTMHEGHRHGFDYRR